MREIVSVNKCIKLNNNTYIKGQTTRSLEMRSIVLHHSQVSLTSEIFMSLFQPKCTTKNILLKNFCSYLFIMNGTNKYGLPYGEIAKLIMIYIISEVKVTKSPSICIGDIYRKITMRLKTSNRSYINQEEICLDQLIRLFSTTITCISKTKNSDKRELIDLFPFDFWESPLKGTKENVSTSSIIVLTKELFGVLTKLPNSEFNSTQFGLSFKV